MPRTARILIDQGYYHIETRGIERTEIVPHLMYLKLGESVPVWQKYICQESPYDLIVNKAFRIR